MTIQWGAWSYAGGNGLRVGIELVLTSSTNVRSDYYLNCQYAYSSDVMNLSESGAYTGTDTITFSAAAGATVKVASHNHSISAGQTLTYGASISGAYNGSTPSVSGVSITAPVVPPSTPGPLSKSNVTSSSFRVTTTAPSNWGGDDWRDVDSGRYDFQCATDSGFTANVDTQNSGDTIGDFSGKTANTRYWCRARAKNDAGFSSWTSAIDFYTLPAAPAATSTPTVARVSDTSQTVTWTKNATSAAPYDQQLVQRAAVDITGATGSFATIATLTGSPSSYSDTSTVANRVYRYQIVAKNSAGSATSGMSGWVHTTPAAPSGVTLTKTAAGDVQIDWAVNATDANSRTDLQVSVNGGSWSALASTGSAAANTYTHSSPPAGSLTYQLRANVEAGSSSDAGFGLASGWVQSGTLATAAAPAAPGNLSPNGSTVDLSRDVVLSWTHNPTDGSPQSGFEVNHSPDGTTWTTTGHVTSATQSWTLPAGTYSNGTPPYWRVRTWGQLTDAGSVSPWSATATMTGSTTPTATISSPGATVGASSADVVVDYYQAEGSAEAAVRVTLLTGDRSQVLKVYSASGAVSGFTLTGLEDGVSYQVDAAVQSSAGLWSDTVTQSFTVSYAPPAQIDVAAEFQQADGSVTVSLYPQSWDGVTTVEPISASLERRIGATGEWVELLSGLDPRAAVTDTTAPIDGQVWYRAVSLSATPSQATGVESQVDVAETEWCYLSAGRNAGYNVTVRFRSNVAFRTVSGRDRASYKFEGRSKRVVMNGDEAGYSLGVSGWLAPDSSSRADVVTVSQMEGPHLWRDPTGRQVYGDLSNVQIEEKVQGLRSRHGVSFSIDETEG